MQVTLHLINNTHQETVERVVVDYLALQKAVTNGADIYTEGDVEIGIENNGQVLINLATGNFVRNSEHAFTTETGSGNLLGPDIIVLNGTVHLIDEELMYWFTEDLEAEDSVETIISKFLFGELA